MAKNVKDAYSEILRLRNLFYQKWIESAESDEPSDYIRTVLSAKYEAFNTALELLSPSIVDPQPEKPVSEDMDKAAFQAYLEAEDKESYTDTYIDGFKAGAKWDRQILTKNAVKGIVHHFGDDEIAAIHYNDPKGVPMSYFVSSNDLKAGDNVKLITIKDE